MVTADDILTLAKRYAEANGVELVTVSSRVFNDGKKLSSIQHGGDLTLKRCSYALQWFSDNWPHQLSWPREVERPAKSERVA